MIRVQQQPLNSCDWLARLEAEAGQCGAVVTFSGRVRDYNASGRVFSIYLEHYPEMTEQAMQDLVDAARLRWPDLGPVALIHRVGEIAAPDVIVFVAVTAPHRKDAFDAACFLMDRLKSDVPLWKQELTEDGWQWVAAKSSDETAAQRWQ